ncbi:MAG: 23S rRNA (guanosine(2251)-2'-O)-methyltransferase RlmB [Thermaerobacter sp.]|nr:23S rRNA (guanosine(2251)-2'-O)-methyltransferase RlmB [Thermaerobacter sp.]
MVMGRNPVRELLRAGRSVSRLWVQEGAAEGSLREILGIAQEHRIPVSIVPRARLDIMAGPVSHQGVMAAVSVKATLAMDDLESLIRRASTPPIVFLLDGVKDPQNLGAIIRVANATGALAVIIPERGAVGLTPVVAKASAGAIEYVPVVRVANLSQAVQTLKTWGVFVYAAQPAAATRYTEIDWRGPVGLVIGGEGEGVRPLVRKRCDGTVFLPMAGAVASLNAATAAAVLGFEVVRQRTGSASPEA